MMTFSQCSIMNEKVSHNQLANLEKYLDKLFNSEIGVGVDFSRHFMERVNDERTKNKHGSDIKISEIRDVFRKTVNDYKQQLAKLPPKFDAHLVSVSKQLDIPFVIKKDKNGDLDIVAKTIIKRNSDWIGKSRPKDGRPVYKTK